MWFELFNRKVCCLKMKPTERYFARGAIYYAVQGGSNLRVR